MRKLLSSLVLLLACTSLDADAWHRASPTSSVSLPTPFYSPSFPADQTFPVTLAGAQASFPGLTSLKAWTFNEASGSIVEQVASGPTLNPSGTPHYAMWTALANGKKNVGLYSFSDYFTTSAASAFDPAGASFTWMIWVRPENIYNVSGYIVDALDDTGHGFQIWMEKGFGASTGQLKAIVKDGTTTLTCASTQMSYQYGSWVFIALSYDTATKTAHLITPEEDATATNGAFVNANLVNTQTSTINGLRAHNTPLDINVAYVAMAAGTVTLSQAQSYVSNYYGTAVGLSTTSPAQVEESTYDNRDPAFGTHVITWGRNQIPREWLTTSRVSWATGHTGGNFYTNSERMGTWTAVGSPAVTDFFIEAPNGSFTGTKINKTGIGTAVGIHQAGSVYVTSAAPSVFLKTDTPHVATLRVVGSHNNTFDTSVNVSVTTAWQQFSIPKTGLNGSDYTTFDFYIYPTDASIDATTGYVYAWGGQLSQTSFNTQYISSNAVAGVQGGPSIIGGTATWPQVSAGWVEVSVIPGTLGDVPYVQSTMNGDGLHGAGLNLFNQASLGLIRNTLFTYPSGNVITDDWDLRNVQTPGRRLEVVASWGNQDSAICVNGDCQTVYPDIAPVTPPLFLTAPFVIAYDVNNPGGGVAHLNYERIAFGNSKLTPHQVREMAAAAGVSPRYRVLALGDSITGFYNGYHAQLAQNLGRNALVVNHGVSGNRTDQIQTRLNALLVDGKASGWTHAIILGGINDIMFWGHTPDYTEANLQAMYSQLHALGIKVIAQTIFPCAGSLAINGGPWGTACSVTVQGYVRQINTWMKTQAYDVDLVVDSFNFMQDPGNPDFILAIWTYDGLHPNILGSNVLGDFIFSTGFGGAQLN